MRMVIQYSMNIYFLKKKLYNLSQDNLADYLKTMEFYIDIKLNFANLLKKFNKTLYLLMNLV